jgi:Outer membrane protein beta-barrel domain
MISFNKKLASIFIILCFSNLSIADDMGLTFGIGTSVNYIDHDNVDDDKSMGIGLTLGYDLKYGFAIEAKVTESDWAIDESTGMIKTKAIYGVYRSQGDFYFLAKLGVLKEKVSLGAFTEEDTGVSYGFGGGFRVTDNFSLEAEYLVVEENINALAFGARAKF